MAQGRCCAIPQLSIQPFSQSKSRPRADQRVDLIVVVLIEVNLPWSPPPAVCAARARGSVGQRVVLGTINSEAAAIGEPLDLRGFVGSRSFATD